jgi:nitrate reductase gamma subunit
MSKLGYIVAAVLGLSAMGVAWQAWQATIEVQMTTTGIVAMILGGLATVALGAGLIALLFFSNRKGFDDRAGAPPTLKRPDDEL